MDCLKVSSKSSPASVAGAIAGMVKDGVPVNSYFADHPEMERVRMVCFDERTKGYYEKALEKLK